MRLGRAAVLGVAIAAGLGAAYLALNLSRAPSAPSARAPERRIDTDQVLVATKDIVMGTTVKADAVTWQDWPKSGASGSFVVRSSTPDGLNQAVGAIARATFYAGEPITEAKLIRSDRGFMSAILPAGKRAVATKISADTSAGGFILPNDRVDVIMTRAVAPGAAGGVPQFDTETILNNIRVLAIDQTVEDKNGEQVVVGQTATLELSPQQAEILTVAAQMSDRLTLALRSIADSEPRPADAGADAFHLVGGTKKSGVITMVKSGVREEVSSTR